METKQKYLEYTAQLENIIQPIFNQNSEDKDSVLLKGIQALSNEVKTKELLVPIVGGFSAGKSSLINAFLGKSYLYVDVTPATALATELRYSEDERIEAVMENGNFDRYSLTQGEDIKAQKGKYKYVRYFIHSQNLKQISPLILVDMPGFASDREGDNKAISDYSYRGVYFICLISVEEGTVQKNIQKCIDELRTYSTEYTFGLTKTDLKPPSQIKELKDEIAEKLDDAFSYEGKVTEFNRKNGEVQLKNILLNEINPEKLFEGLFKSQLLKNNQEIISNIESKIATLKSGKAEAEEAIRNLNEKSQKMAKDNQKIIEKLRNGEETEQDIRRIIQSVVSAINENTDRLASFAIKDQYGMRYELEDLVKRVLVRELKDRISYRVNRAGKAFAHNMDVTLSSSLSALNMDTNFIKEIIERCQKSIEETDLDMKDIIDTLAKLSGILSLIFGGLAKILEKVLSFVGPILELFFSSSKPEPEDPLPKIKEAIRSKVIRDLEEKLNRELPDTFNKALADAVSNINNQMNDEVKKIKQSMEDELKQKETTKEDKEKRIALLENGKQQLNQLAIQYLN